MAQKFITKQILPGGQEEQRLLEIHLLLSHPRQGLVGPAARGLSWPVRLGLLGSTGEGQGGGREGGSWSYACLLG